MDVVACGGNSSLVSGRTTSLCARSFMFYENESEIFICARDLLLEKHILGTARGLNRRSLLRKMN
jgi:hypothetical protein